MNYHKDFTHWSKSFLSQFLKSPLAAKIYMNAEHIDSSAMNFGRAYHLTIEGINVPVYDFNSRPDTRYSMTAKKNAEWLKEMKKEYETIVSDEEMAIIDKMISVLKSNETYKKIATFKPKQEEPFTTKINGIYPVKCKPDAICEHSALIVDWKTIDSIEDWNIYLNVRKYNYDMQAALYCDILKEITGVKHNFLFMFQEKSEPYDVLPVLVRHNSETYERGQNKYMVCCERAKNAFDNDNWEGAASKFDNGILELD